MIFLKMVLMIRPITPVRATGVDSAVVGPCEVGGPDRQPQSGPFCDAAATAQLTPDLADKGPGISVCSLPAIISWNENRQPRTECGCISIPHPGRD
jgi:hypothetical protein